MAQLTIADRTGTVDGVIFPESFAQHGHLLQPDAILIVSGTIDRSRGPTNIFVESAFPMETAAQHLGTFLDVSFEEAVNEGEPLAGLMQMVAGTLRQAAGTSAGVRGRAVEVRVHLPVNGTLVTLAPARLRVVPEPSLLAQLRQMLGNHSVRVQGGFVPKRERRGGWKRRAEGEEAHGQRMMVGA